MEPDQYLYFFKNNALPSTAASMTLAMSIKLTKNWIQSRQREQLLEKEKLETELKFLRSQFHPHFLFNTINSIFVLIHKNPDMASEALAKFSDLLRYQLYECNEAEISLRQELTYLENFIELEKLRHDNEDLEVQVQLEIPPSNELTIVPFVLISFIENAFKHVSQSKAQPNWIKIKLWLEGLQLHSSISNSIAPNTQRIPEEHTDHGLGLQQVRRRLNLLYQETHELHIRQSVFAFQVDLQLRLHEAPLTSSPALAADLITR